MSTSIGYSGPIGGSGGVGSPFVMNLNNPGGAIKGYMPQQTLKVDKTYPEYEQIRFTLRDAWNTTYPSQLKNSNLKQPITTPFRAVTNSGDLLSRENYSCGGTCQTPQSRPNIKGLKQHFGYVQKSCVPSAVYSNLQLNDKIPAAACNVRYVYDSSDYTTYLKQKAVNKNYNDLSYGGDNSNASQVSWKAIRRY
jgi:hypothetical protein